MKKTKVLFMLLAVLVLTFTMSFSQLSFAFAENWEFSGECAYDGEDITGDFDTDSMAASVQIMEPGDYLDYTVTYTNDSDNTTDWYMKNEVLETLEENKDQAENGGYTYVLTNVAPDGTETVLFDNSVGGENEDVDLEGLLQATNATGDFFFIQKLESGESGQTLLHIEFDGETEVNDYMDTYGKLMLGYAVEEQNDETTIKRIIVKTGDTTNILPYAALFVGALVLLIVALFGMKRSRSGKDGDQA